MFIIAINDPDLTCEATAAPPNGALDNNDEVFFVGDTQSITCHPGFAATGATSSICTADGDGISAMWIPDLSFTMCTGKLPY